MTCQVESPKPPSHTDHYTAVATECLVHWACMSKRCQWATSLAGGVGLTAKIYCLREKLSVQY